MEKNKKILVPMIIAVSTLVLLVVGSAYAYFTASTSNDFGVKTITSTAESLGNVALTANNNLSISLTAADMMNKGSDVTYYASSAGKTTTPTTETIGTASVSGVGTYTCSYILTMDDNSSSMYDAFQNMDGKSEGQIVLTINGVDYDFKSSGLFPKTINGTLKGITEGYPRNITASLKLVNKTSVNQSDLIGTNITITFNVTSFSCNAVDQNAGYQILAMSTNNLSNEMLGGLNRYQGTADVVDNNYVCFGTSDKDTCTDNTATYMYRIIGINEEGQLKLIMKEALHDSWYYWHSENKDISWADSDLFKGLNGLTGGYYNNIFVNHSSISYMATTNEWYNKVANTNWKYGASSINGESNGWYYADRVYEVESAWKTTVDAKIGLMYISDFLYSYGEGISGSNAYKSWMHLSNNDTSVASEYERTMVYLGLNYDSYYKSYYIENSTNGGSPQAWYIINPYTIRPVFYTTTDVSLAGGTGSLQDPYILK